MINFESLIPEEITLAPKHPLAQNLELAIPDPHSGFLEEIREIQQREHIPGVVKCIIPFDLDTSWEYGWCVPNRLLLKEDIDLIVKDLARVESILEKLLWLFGGHCFAQYTSRQGDQLAVFDWQQVRMFARQYGFGSYLLDIDYLPTVIKRYNQFDISTEDDNNLSQIAVEPAHWHIEFLQLTRTRGCLEIQYPKTICSCQIWTGKPFFKNLLTGQTTTRYDLWVSRPLDLTQPPWRK